MAGEALLVVVGLGVQAMGVALMVVGAAGLVVSFLVWGPWRRSRGRADPASTPQAAAGPPPTDALVLVRPLRVPGARRSRVTLAPGYPWDDLDPVAQPARRRAS